MKLWDPCPLPHKTVRWVTSESHALGNWRQDQKLQSILGHTVWGQPGMHDPLYTHARLNTCACTNIYSMFKEMVKTESLPLCIHPSLSLPPSFLPASLSLSLPAPLLFHHLGGWSSMVMCSRQPGLHNETLALKGIMKRFLFKMWISNVWWLMPIILTPRRLRQENDCGFEASLGYIVTFRPDPISKTNKSINRLTNITIKNKDANKIAVD